MIFIFGRNRGIVLGKEAEIVYKITMLWKQQLENTKNRIIKSKGYMTRKREINSI